MSERFTLTLTLAVTYEGDPADCGVLEDNLLDLAARATQEALLTVGTESEVVVANPSVERLL